MFKVKALEVIESALTSETLAKYCAAYLSGKHINDQLYDTWKMYKTKCNKANASKSLSVQQLVDGLHPLPQETKVQSCKRKSTKRRGKEKKASRKRDKKSRKGKEKALDRSKQKTEAVKENNIKYVMIVLSDLTIDYVLTVMN